MKNVKNKTVDQMNIKELVVLDTSKFNRGQLQNYMFMVGEHRRVMKKEIDVLDEIIRDVSNRLSKASV